MNKLHQYKQKPWKLSIFYIKKCTTSNQKFPTLCSADAFEVWISQIKRINFCSLEFQNINAIDTIIWLYELCKWNFILQLFNHHIKRWIMLKLKMLLWIEVQIWKERGLQGNCVLDKNIRNCRKKLSTIREKNEIGFNLDIQPEH